MTPKTIIFIGSSGSGKGTQVKLLSKYIEKIDGHEYFHLEAGQRFRKFISEDSYTSILSRDVSNAGSLQPEFLSIWVWSGELIQNLNKYNNLYIDGTPRRIVEAKILVSALDFYERTDVDVVYLKVSREKAIARMSTRGRADDLQQSDIIGRMDWFDRDVIPVIDFFRAHKSYHFHEVDGEQEIDQVQQDIIKTLNLG